MHLLLILSLAVMLCLLCMPGSASQITVCPSGCNYTSIQEAVNAAHTGDTILVYPGTYNESLVIDRSLTLEGIAGPGGRPLVISDTGDAGVTITSEGVLVSTLAFKSSLPQMISIEAPYTVIRNCSMEHDTPADTPVVIIGERTSHCVIEANHIMADGNGISFSNVENVSITENVVNGAYGGKFCAIELFFDTAGTYPSNRVIGNILSGNDYGISIDAENDQSLLTYTHVEDNEVSGNALNAIELLAENTYSTFSANLVKDSDIDPYQMGMVFSNACHGTFSENRVNDCSLGEGMHIENAANLTVTANEVMDTDGLGLSLVEVGESTVTGNTMAGNAWNFNYDPAGYLLNPDMSIDESNTADGKPILYIELVDGVDIDGAVVGPDHYGAIYCIECSNVSITGMQFSHAFSGIGLYGVHETNISGNSFSDCYKGISMFLVRGPSIYENTAEDTYLGIYGNLLLAGSIMENEMQKCGSGIELEGIFMSVNVTRNAIRECEVGIHVHDSGGIIRYSYNQNQITECRAGMLLEDSRSLQIVSNMVTDCWESGIIVYGSYDCLVHDNTCTGNGNGIAVTMAAFDNLIYRNHVTDSTEAGVLILAAGRNKFYNNYFNNNVPVEITAHPGYLTNNTWNITPEAGPNIVGGPDIGGNYWAAPDGSGWSQTHADPDGDGFVNEPFILGTENTDYFPLASWPPDHYSSLQAASAPADASVFINGVERGKTPLRLEIVPVGLHPVTISKPGYYDWTGFVNVREGLPATVYAILRASTGSLTVISSPSDATVQLDGEESGQTTVTLSDLTAGEHSVSIDEIGYSTWNRSVQVTGGRPSVVTAVLTPDVGSIKVISYPSGAMIYLDGEEKGNTPQRLSDIPVGTHVVTLEKDWYLPWEREVRVSGGRMSLVTTRLIRDGPVVS